MKKFNIIHFHDSVEVWIGTKYINIIQTNPPQTAEELTKTLSEFYSHTDSETIQAIVEEILNPDGRC